jgi:hypothetical protein
MIIEDIIFREGEVKTELPDCKIPLMELVPVQIQVLKGLKLFLESYESKEWLHKASVNVLSRLYLKEANIQLAKAKQLQKERYPNRVKLEVWKQLFKNPIKSLWLLKLK